MGGQERHWRGLVRMGVQILGRGLVLVAVCALWGLVQEVGVYSWRWMNAWLAAAEGECGAAS